MTSDLLLPIDQVKGGEKGKTMVDFSDSLKNAFKKWNVRTLLLVSLLLQVLLILLAPRRRRSTSEFLSFLIWSGYLLAEGVATSALGLLMSQGGSNCDTTAAEGNIIHDGGQIMSTSKRNLCQNYDNNLLAFWATFLLLHLGGPDNITAFSMEDNSLWKRHLVGLFTQGVKAVYVVLLSLPHNRLLAATILMFLAGTIKYLERTCALYFASSNVNCGSFKGFEGILETRNEDSEWPDYNALLFVYELFKQNKGIIFDRGPSMPSDFTSFTKISKGKRFKLIEWELSFVYDALFTKAAVVHTCIGYALRVLCSSLILAASILFFLSSKHDFMRLDISITYVLLAGAISLDILAYYMLIFSKWTVVRLKKFNSSTSHTNSRIPQTCLSKSHANSSRPLIEIIASSIFKRVSKSKDWSGLMMQKNLMKSCVHPLSNLWIADKLESTWSTWSKSITPAFGNFILEFLDSVLQKRPRLAAEPKKPEEKDPREVLDEELRVVNWAFIHTIEFKLDERILRWHVVTNLLYYTEDEGTTSGGTTTVRQQKLSMVISNYMVYLSDIRMIPSAAIANWDMVYKNTRAAIISALKSGQNQKFKKAEDNDQRLKEACEILLSDSSPCPGSELKNAVLLAKSLKNLPGCDRWERVAIHWAQMLLYAANNCPGIALGQSLSRGGELLTFACFLLHHLGLGRCSYGVPAESSVYR